MPGSNSKPKTRTFLRFLNYIRPYWKYVAASAIGGVIKFTVPLLVPQITRYLFDRVFLNPQLSSAAKFQQLYFSVGWLAAIFILVWMPGTYVRHYYSGKAGHRSVFDLRCDLYERVLRMSASFFQRHKSGGIVSRLINDIALAQNLVGNALTNVWIDSAALLFILVFMFQIDVTLTLVALITFPFYIYFYRSLGGKLKQSSLQVQQEIETISGNLQERIAGSLVVHAFVREKYEQEHFHKDSEKLFATTMKTVSLSSLNLTITGILTSLAPLIVLVFGGWQVIRGRLTVGELVAVSMYLNPLYLPLQRFSELNVVFSNSMAALDRIFEIMDEKPEIRDAPGAVELQAAAGRVRFENVSFAYDPDHPVLHAIDFEAEPGRKMALVGQSGSGKTTLVSLIPRFYEVTSGAIQVDGVDVRDLKVKSLRRQIGMVLQDPVLFSGTIRENILYGNPRAGEAEVVKACIAANAYEFIQRLPHGLDTEVGERGAFLSGGQKQRLTIARAFLKDPKILILDEATSSLDVESEQLIQEALNRLMENRTTFIIAHRLSTIIDADRILVLHQGTICESGSHQQLIRAGGIYQTLYSKQFALARVGG
jgi:ABC-type multidrug transport system fused ATPase/permease subunit